MSGSWESTVGPNSKANNIIKDAEGALNRASISVKVPLTLLPLPIGWGEGEG
jgi:hypothetical protein